MNRFMERGIKYSAVIGNVHSDICRLGIGVDSGFK